MFTTKLLGRAYLVGGLAAASLAAYLAYKGDGHWTFAIGFLGVVWFCCGGLVLLTAEMDWTQKALIFCVFRCHSRALALLLLQGPLVFLGALLLLLLALAVMYHQRKLTVVLELVWGGLPLLLDWTLLSPTARGSCGVHRMLPAPTDPQPSGGNPVAPTMTEKEYIANSLVFIRERHALGLMGAGPAREVLLEQRNDAFRRWHIFYPMREDYPVPKGGQHPDYGLFAQEMKGRSKRHLVKEFTTLMDIIFDGTAKIERPEYLQEANRARSIIFNFYGKIIVCLPHDDYHKLVALRDLESVSIYDFARVKIDGPIPLYSDLPGDVPSQPQAMVPSSSSSHPPVALPERSGLDLLAEASALVSQTQNPPAPQHKHFRPWE